MSTLTYKCPSCGAPLVYQGDTQTLDCNSCGNSFSGETVRKVSEIDSQSGKNDTSWDMQNDGYTQQEAERTRTFSCTSCGAELVTDETTVATNCAFCGSPSIIPAQFTPGTRPDKVIPFIVKKEEAERAFHQYFRGKKMLPDAFLKGKNQISRIMQLYVPYWLFNCRADADISYNATQVHSHRSGNYIETITRHFLVRRAGSLDFENLPIDAHSRIDNDITETLEPYKTESAIDFSPEVLSGAMANRADVSTEECKRRADQRISDTIERTMRQTVQGYNSVSTRSRSINIPQGQSTPALFPLWQITTIKDGKPYTFAINGQTGKLTTNIPYSKGKFFGWALGIAGIFTALAFAAVTALLMTGGM